MFESLVDEAFASKNIMDIFENYLINILDENGDPDWDKSKDTIENNLGALTNFPGALNERKVEVLT